MDNQIPSAESNLRSVAKGVSYRFVGTLASVVISFGMTGSARIAALIGSTEILAKTLLFWGHERLWQRISWGRGDGELVRRGMQSRPEQSTARNV